VFLVVSNAVLPRFRVIMSNQMWRSWMWGRLAWAGAGWCHADRHRNCPLPVSVRDHARPE